MYRSLLAPLTMILAAGLFVAFPLPVAGSEVHTITIERMKFVPATLTVKQGDKVVWVNKDLFPHTATTKTKGFDSGNIAADASWTFEAKTKGEFPYLCTYHPPMTGVLIVK